MLLLNCSEMVSRKKNFQHSLETHTRTHTDVHTAHMIFLVHTLPILIKNCWFIRIGITLTQSGHVEDPICAHGSHAPSPTTERGGAGASVNSVVRL